MLNGIKLVRIDYRLIHGQVITKWCNIIHTTQIIVVNDELANDEFMTDIYVMAAPPGVDVRVISVDAFARETRGGAFEQGAVLILFKDIADCARAVKVGVPLRTVQVGGLGSSGGRTSIVKGIAIDKNDADLLSSIEDAGVVVTFQVQPEEPMVTLDQARKKLNERGPAC